MFGKDKAKLAALIVAKSSKPKEEEEEDYELDGLSSAMELFIKAVSKRDTEAAVEAFKDLISLCTEE